MPIEHKIIAVLFMLFGLITMLFAKQVNRAQNSFQEKFRPRSIKKIEKYISEHRDDNIDKFEAKVVKNAPKFQYVLTVVGGAIFFVAGLLILLGVIQMRQ